MGNHEMSKYVLSLKKADLTKGIFFLRQVIKSRADFLKKVGLCEELDDQCKALQGVLSFLEALKAETPSTSSKNQFWALWMRETACFLCGRVFETSHASQKFCDLACRNDYYEGKVKPRKPRREDILVDYRRKYKRAHGDIAHDWHVHHIDGDTKNNSLENLIALPRSVHVIVHTLSRAKKRMLNREEIEKILKEE